MLRTGSWRLAYELGRAGPPQTNTLGNMNKRLVLTLYLALWAAVAGSLMYGTIRAGYSIWAATGFAFFLFFFVNGSLSYWGLVRRLKIEGREPPGYFRYLFFPKGLPKAKGPAPRSTHLLVGVAATATGAFFSFCGIALAFNIPWLLTDHPLFGASVCIVLAGIGGVFLYAAWRLFSFAKESSANVA